MDDLVKEFIDETMDSLSEIDMDLVKLEQEPNNQELLGKIFRLMHTIKGTCGFIGLDRLEKTAHAAENLLDNFRSGSMTVTEEYITILLIAIDRVRYLVTEVNKTGKEPDGDDSDVISEIEKAIDDHKNQDAVTEDNNEESSVEITATDEEPEEKENTPELPSTPSTASSSAMVNDSNPEYLRVQVGLLENMVNMVSELVLTRNQLLQLIRSDENSNMQAPLHHLNRIVSDLQDNVMKTRMQPIGNAWGKLPRIVRDLSTELKKKITLEMEGEDTELDRQVLDLIKDPLTHMIRNACDHGIETPDIRLEKGKGEKGTIKLRAYHEGGFIIINISDDGKGLDPEKIGQKAVEKGLIDENKLASLSEKQILNHIMKPGFSTAEQVTNVSGRGVGMDVVRSNIEKIGGTIEMDSKLGQGTSFVIHIPLTLAIISALIVEIEDHRYAIPQINIQELVSLRYADENLIEYIENKPVLRLRDRIIPLLDSQTLFAANGAQKDQGTEATRIHKEKTIVIMSSGNNVYGLLVDEIFDTEEVVIKSVSSVLRDVNIFSGNSILGDGQVIMILDPTAIARQFHMVKDATESDLAYMSGEKSTKTLAKETASLLIFKAGDGVPKAVPLALVSRLHVFETTKIKKSGFKHIVQYNDDLMQLLFCDSENQSLDNHAQTTTIILSDDRSESQVGMMIDDIIDINEGVLDLNTSTARPGFLGSMIINEQTVDVIDIAYYLGMSQDNWFSSKTHMQSSFISEHLERLKQTHQHAENEEDAKHLQNNNKNALPTVVSGKKQHLLVVDDSAFFRNMLQPILRSAGYEVSMAVDALDAIKLHDEGHMYDIILSDIEMPEMDGYEFVEKMQDDSNWKDTPFIAITSHNTAQDKEYGYKKGFKEYLGKFDKTELFDALTQIGAA
ncbi:MAG: hybrid sensor histidine kinase/response regulator [Micavibrio sp.]|nr:hybrid sensor histidine kinase/response regulator [Micavibrio sp.]HCK32248.1 hybrid sensor histidine kinase/response regulator [Rhodospirillaceae bacterium]